MKSSRYDRVSDRVARLLGLDVFSELSKEEVCIMGDGEYTSWRDLSYKENIVVAIDRLKALRKVFGVIQEDYLEKGKNIYIRPTDHFHFRAVERFAMPEVKNFKGAIKRAYQHCVQKDISGEVRYFDKESNRTIVLEKQGMAWFALITTWPGEKHPNEKPKKGWAKKPKRSKAYYKKKKKEKKES